MNQEIPWIDKPFALFYGSCYYPCGGFCDFENTFDSVESAVKSASDQEAILEWWHVVDLRTLKVVSGNREGLFGVAENMKDIKQ